MYPAIHILGRNISTYSLAAVAGVGFAFLLLLYTHKKRGVERMDIMFFAIYALIGAFIGAKVLYFIVEFKTVLANPMAFLSGGMVFYSGVIGGVGGGIVYAHRYKLRALPIFDCAVPAVALGHAFGRVGCFLVGCCYGAPTAGPLGVVYPPDGGIAPAGVPLLPTQLFEAAFLLLLSGALLLILVRTRRLGAPTGMYLLLYGIWRFLIEFFRSDPRGAVGALSTSQFISLFIVALGVLFLVYGDRLHLGRRKPAPPAL